MKKLTLLLAAFFMLNSAFAQSLSKVERKAASQYMKWSTKEFKKSIKGLSEAQLNFKADPDKWSVKDCAYHIAFSEGALRGALDGTLAGAPDPVAKAELKSTDDQIKGMITSRETKVKTMQPFEPQNTGFKSLAEALTAYDAKRGMLMDLVKTTAKDLRNYVVVLPFGKMDAYQFTLFIAGHTNRHTQQIAEVKASAGFPAK